MKWATRAGCHVDRIGCAWLIRRFVDHEAVFVFVDDSDDVPTEATPFDMRGVELSIMTVIARSKRSCVATNSMTRCCGTTLFESVVRSSMACSSIAVE